MLTVGSLFAGIGGFDLGWERAGFQVRWQVEIDPRAQAVLARHWPDVPRFGDIRTVDPAALEPVDVVTFGSPCQDLSVAGKRAGLLGERSSLFYEALRIITALRPAFAVWENVPGAFSSNAGRDFAAVLAAFRDSGVRECAWRVLDAQYFGVPQRRRRVFLVANYRGERATQVLFEPDGGPRHPPSRRKAGSVVASLLASGAGTSRPAGIASELDFLVTQALTGTFGTGGADDTKAQAGFIIPIQDVRGGTRDKTDAGQGIGIAPEGAPMYTLDATSQHAVAYALRADPGGTGQGHNVSYVLVDEPTVVHTLRAEGADASEDGTGRGTPLIPVGMAVRRLTPRECERLMGLPDDWTRWRPDGREISDSARYRLVGNAVAVPVVEWIARRMRAVMHEERGG